ncbi:MAG TPA: homocysteine biosynthesis protein [Syntrophales bacterium]|nr:homocysteine biosynthesis protein [Syntrophales bacterium]HPX11965.1 homocysteine biosynthesis protein [Syntrophales bacterium]HQB30819.1 homocysteine biosynthesis protein [Syntrophales bacterium]HQN78407.1 homocysteine biosynthesis protein [Syntrophales bacterium]HQQ27219.1 homocysteine biosynthesis protein [Syntrophales bacterium]
MKPCKVTKTYREINEKIRRRKAVVVTAEEIIDIVDRHGEEEAARRVDVVTTGTFSPMCSSGAFLNFGHSSPRIKASRVWLNDVPAYGGIAAVDCYIGATEVVEGDPLNSVYPGEFNYGGGHVIEDLVSGNVIRLRAEGYGTDCYPSKRLERNITLKDLPDAMLFNPRNAYQNYNVAVNLSDKTIYTYMGVLRPQMANANYSTSGQLSPLFNDPYYETIGIGTAIFLGGTRGYVAWPGTQHNPNAPRTAKGIPREGAGTIAVIGNLKEMDPRWLVGASILGYGVSLYVGIGVPIPVLNERMARHAAVRDEDIVMNVFDYGMDVPSGNPKSLGEVTFKDLRSGAVTLNGRKIPSAPLSSYFKAQEIAALLKERIEKGEFFLGEPQWTLPSVSPDKKGP